MIKIITDTPSGVVINLDSIPVGTVFTGTVATRPGTPVSKVTGTFYKAHGPFALSKRDGTFVGVSPEVLVIQLGGGPPNIVPVWMWCREVTNYRPATKAELKLTF